MTFSEILHSAIFGAPKYGICQKLSFQIWPIHVLVKIYYSLGKHQKVDFCSVSLLPSYKWQWKEMDVFKIHNLGFTCFCISISYGKYWETFIFYGAQSRVITQINVLHS